MNFWLDHCWTVLDFWVISSLGFQLELFVSLLCSEGLEWVVSLEISAGFIGSNLEWVEKLGKMEDSPASSQLEGELLVAEWILHKHIRRAKRGHGARSNRCRRLPTRGMPPPPDPHHGMAE